VWPGPIRLIAQLRWRLCQLRKRITRVAVVVVRKRTILLLLRRRYQSIGDTYIRTVEGKKLVKDLKLAEFVGRHGTIDSSTGVFSLVGNDDDDDDDDDDDGAVFVTGSNNEISNIATSLLTTSITTTTTS